MQSYSVAASLSNHGEATRVPKRHSIAPAQNEQEESESDQFGHCHSADPPHVERPRPMPMIRDSKHETPPTPVRVLSANAESTVSV